MFRRPLLLVLLGVGLIPVPSKGSCEWDFGVPVGNNCGAVPAEGCCKAGMYRYWCDGGTLCMEECWLADCGYVALLGSYQCGTLMGVGADSCPAIPEPCLPDCASRECGDDGCGGSCGACYGAQVCSGGRCVTPCVPSCQGRECGDDGCGGTCGACPSGKVCLEGTCSLPDCTPDCAGKECGDNGCGGTCGACPDGTLCKDGRCEGPQACRPACEGRECGPDGCDGVCGVCPRGMTCDPEGICREEGWTCAPRCEGRVCGEDGCGGSCGECEAGQECVAGQCKVPGEDEEAPGDGPVPDRGETGPEQWDAVPPSVMQCPAGQSLRYGTCVPDPREASSGGCRLSPRAAVFPWLLPLLGIGIALSRRRRPER